MKISEVSKVVGLSVATIRYYSGLGLIPSEKRDLAGERIFDDEAVVWLQGIKFQRDLGIPLSEIKKYIALCQQTGPAAVKRRYKMLLKQREKAKSDFLDSVERMDIIDSKIKREEEIMKGKRSDSLSAARRFSQ
ncbi:MerR family transcriptional regulator [Companilactobacillus futsaii]|uniref:MerR family transcriptional regulator n=2 Tax=Companilactobacillus futsaii TaxID=938155 RepID=A0A5B7SZH1_9LACO|nr:MerR family transcriptional regulator [Companilactobacillus futsaii]KRK99112.1 MerR family transcriptional regulator [Companilactobacillus futsaii JCM 17355]QCX23679.1 MerR family transcriptional regulator [Companilactobacillus futsaii]